MNSEQEDHSTATARWQPLSATQRRVLGVLVEKAKTTPDTYPLTVNALTNGCNQKSNRYPKMELETYEVEEGLEQLRQLGVVTEVWGSGRVAKYRHDAYDWLGIDKPEMAVIVELLLRGEQTVGELRGRAARMEPIADLATLQPILVTLQEKGLVIPLTTAGRGQKVTHGLYQDAERPQSPQSSDQVLSEPAGKSESLLPTVQMATPPAVVTVDMYNELQVELAELQAEVSRLKGRIEELEIVDTEAPSGGP